MMKNYKRTCTKCGIEQEIGQFSIDRAKSYGRRPSCKTCAKKQKANLYKKNKERTKKRTREWAENNEERVVENQKKWQAKNKEKLKKYWIEHKKKSGRVSSSIEYNKNKKEMKEEMMEEYGYIYCQLCMRSNKQIYDVHHIIFRSEAPHHEKLHSKENLIIVCRSCHKKLHGKKSLRDPIVEERCLKFIQ